jgi:hypothetical protein
MKIGRNDPCPCGSGKKYKKCCLNKTEYDKIKEVVHEAAADDKLSTLLCNMLHYMKDKNWIGACHATSATMFVGLSELGYLPKLCMGEVNGSFLFDHSWIELDGKIIDLAASMTLLNGMPASSPVVLDIDIDTREKHLLNYGVSGRGLDAEARRVMAQPFDDYMRNYPNETNGLWGVVNKILPAPTSVATLREKYAEVKWTVIGE